jgi:hypothetical protein
MLCPNSDYGDRARFEFLEGYVLMKKTKVEFPPKQSVFTYLEDYDKNPPT